MKIIAEIGLNHCGSIKRAQRLVEDLNQTSVDAVSIQMRENSFYDRSHPRKIELPTSFYEEAIGHVHSANKLMCMAIAEEQKISIFNEMGIDFWKTLSWDINNQKLINNLQKTNKQIYLSTGMSSLDEIIKVAKRGKGVELIHTQLNDLIENSNLKAIKTIRDATGNRVAFGLHCKNRNVLYTALGFEPSAIFFYIKDDTNSEHPDDAHAIPIHLVEETIREINQLAKCIGSGEKVAMENIMHPEDDNVCDNRNR